MYDIYYLYDLDRDLFDMRLVLASIIYLAHTQASLKLLRKRKLLVHQDLYLLRHPFSFGFLRLLLLCGL